MTRRSRAREVALQLLFQRDHNPDIDRAAVERFVADRLRDVALQPFCLSLYDGVVSRREEIDNRLTAAADNWRLSRMATVDRNVLRLGAFELVYGNETPPPVAFDEAIELARRYGSAESAGFVNGVLDRLRREAAGAERPEGATSSASAESPASAEAMPVSPPPQVPAPETP